MVTIKYKNQEVDCHGVLNDEDIIIMVSYLNGNDYEDLVDNHNYNTDEPFKNWTEAVHYLIDLNRFGEIIELSQG
jgi:hypothetical protein